VLQVDALDDGGHLGGGDLDTFALGRWETENAAFQVLRPDHITVAVPMEDFDAIATPIEKKKRCPARGS
jgi:hypothetical protein